MFLWVKIVVGEDGTTGSCRVVRSSGDILGPAAIAAATQWKFQPPTYKSKPVSVEIGVTAPESTEIAPHGTQGFGTLIRGARFSGNVIVMVFPSLLIFGGRPRTRWMTTFRPELVNFMFKRLGPCSGAIMPSLLASLNLA